jgi:hypothetical protein
VPEPIKTNWRLMRVAEQICQCDLTDGFCHPQHKPDCRCWRLAFFAMKGVENQSNPALEAAWGNESEEARRARLNALVRSITSASDELSQRHFEQRRAE